MSKYNDHIEDIQGYIRNTKAEVEFNDGTVETLPIAHIGQNGIAVKSSAYIKRNNIENAYPYKVLNIIEDES